MTAQTEKSVIAIFVAFVAFAVLIAGILFYQESQPKPEPAPQPIRPTPTKVIVRSLPATTEEATINCYLDYGETWRPLQYLAVEGVVYVMIESRDGCHGWIVDP